MKSTKVRRGIAAALSALTFVSIVTFVATVLVVTLPKQAAAGYFEVTSGFSFNKSNYGEGNFEWTRRWSASIGYHLGPRTQIEFSFVDSVSRTFIDNYQDTTFHDKTYSAAWVQSLFGPGALFNPYFKLGAGQLDRVATGTYYALGGASADAQTGSLTEIIGVGLRIGLSKRFGIRAEANTYITDFKLSSWQDNIYFTSGLSLFF